MRLIANVILRFIGGVVGVSVPRLFGDTAMTGFTLTGLIVTFVRAVIVVAGMTLSGRPVPPTPATVAELAEKVRARFEGINRNLDDFLVNITEEEAAHQPAPGEWSIKDVLAHLIHDERSLQNYIAQVVDEHEAHYDDFPSNMQFLNDATMSVYPTLAELHQALRHATQETVELFNHLPESFREHKGSFWRMMYAALSDPHHYLAHMEQMQEALTVAREKLPLAGL